jgi:hypothetical protein
MTTTQEATDGPRAKVPCRYLFGKYEWVSFLKETPPLHDTGDDPTSLPVFVRDFAMGIITTAWYDYERCVWETDQPVDGLTDEELSDIDIHDALYWLRLTENPVSL